MTSIDLVAKRPVAAFMPAVTQQAVPDSTVIENERPGDAEAREALLNRAFGPARFRKTCERLRAGRLPARGLSLVARLPDGLGDGMVVGTVRLWHVDAGGIAALMLGPLAVDDRFRRYGVGAQLMEDVLARRALGHAAVVLVGDASYYARFGFTRARTVGLRLPGPVDEARFLGCELEVGALAAAAGMISATGAMDPANRRFARQPRMGKAA